ncbi:unnamed protein product, partial [Mesorhabditis belari]|uniref:Beta-1,4-mannosyltransferase n=1 Tax=Mesorhabditis belari TaxID=2138241 RepID=A0AAF3J5Y3_9BILA
MKSQKDDVDPVDALETVSRLLSSSGKVPKVSSSRVVKKIAIKAIASKENISKADLKKPSSSQQMDRQAFYRDQNGYTACAIESCRNSSVSEIQPLSFVVKRAIASIIQIFPSIVTQNDYIEELLAFIEKHSKIVDIASKFPMHEFPIRICQKHLKNELGGDNTIPALIEGDPRLTPRFADCIKGVAQQLERRINLFKEYPDLLASFIPQSGQPQTPIRCGITYCPSSSLTVNPNALRFFRLFRVPQNNEEKLRNWIQMLHDKGVTISIDTLRLRTHICEMHFYRGDPKQAWECYREGAISKKVTTTMDLIRCVIKSCPIRGNSKKADGTRYLFTRIPEEGTPEYRRWAPILNTKTAEHVLPIKLPMSRICERHFKLATNGKLDFSMPVRFPRGAMYEFKNQHARKAHEQSLITENRIAKSSSVKKCCLELFQMEQMLKKLKQKKALLQMQTIHCLRAKGLEIPEFLGKEKVLEDPLSHQRKAMPLKLGVSGKSLALSNNGLNLRAPSANELPNLLKELAAIRKVNRASTEGEKEVGNHWTLEQQGEKAVMKQANAVIVVLGDIGRSPRMANHAYSLATQQNYIVYIVGYTDTKLHPMLLEDSRIKCVSLAAPCDLPCFIPDKISLVFKVIWTFLALFFSLIFRVPWAIHLILMQNPPGLPAMLVCWMGSRWVIDWHNYTYRMLQYKWKLSVNLPKLAHDSDEIKSEKAGETTKRRISKEEREVAKRKTSKFERKTRKSYLQMVIEKVHWYEGCLGRRADASICVSRAMREDLRESWAIPSAIFYDRPPDFKFKTVTLEEVHDLFMELSSDDSLKAFRGKQGNDEWKESSAFTYCTLDGQVKQRLDRPLFLISSTSWTPDEDFEILLDALIKYDRYSINSSDTVRIVCAVTGKGDQKEEYVERIKRLQLSNVQIVTPWLKAKDYPTLLAASDLGISLHASTSGLDLPMKVVDMFGARIPVLAKRYLCIGELVKEGVNGKTFENANELNQLIQGLAVGFPNNCNALNKLKANVLSEPLPSWEDTWKAVCGAIMEPERDAHLERVLARE